MLDNATYSGSGNEYLKAGASLPAFSNLTWIYDTVSVSTTGDWEVGNEGGTKDFQLTNGAIEISGTVRIAAGQKMPSIGHLTDGDTKHWRVTASEVTETLLNKACKGTLTVMWEEDFHAAVAAGDYTLTAMTLPPATAIFAVPS